MKHIDDYNHIFSVSIDEAFLYIFTIGYDFVVNKDFDTYNKLIELVNNRQDINLDINLCLIVDTQKISRFIPNRAKLYDITIEYINTHYKPSEARKMMEGLSK